MIVICYRTLEQASASFHTACRLSPSSTNHTFNVFSQFRSLYNGFYHLYNRFFHLYIQFLTFLYNHFCFFLPFPSARRCRYVRHRRAITLTYWSCWPPARRRRPPTTSAAGWWVGPPGA